MTSPSAVVGRLYELRRRGDPELLRPLLADGVHWQEPVVGNHMGLLIGPDAVIEMMSRALATTGDSFTLEMAQAVETGNACAAVIRWRADKGGKPISGRELAVYVVEDGRIVQAAFFAERLADDDAFWA